MYKPYLAAESAQMSLGLGSELVVDLFAGAGGASTGIAAALGRPVDIAINHHPRMIAIHKHNHPQTRHYISDVFEVCPLEATKRVPVGLLHFSSDCRHFSKASGASKKDERIRSLTWVALRWAYHARPRVITSENVEEIATWGPLDENGKPIKEKAGLYYDGFLKMMTTGIEPDHPALDDALDALDHSVPREALIRGLGFDVQTRELRAENWGVRTIRKRWYMIARSDGRPIAWPKPTHGTAERPVKHTADAIRWREPAASIFLTRDEAKAWGQTHERAAPKRPLVENTLKRVAHGIKKFVIEAEDPYLVDAPGESAEMAFMAQHNTGVVGRKIRAPLSTICRTGSHQALVKAKLQRKLTGYMVPRYGERDGQAPRCRALDGPLSTITPTSNEGSLVIPVLTPAPKQALALSHFYSSNTCGGQGDLRAPLTTITAGGQHQALLSAQLGGDASRRKQVQDFLAPHFPDVPYEDLGVVMIDGVRYEITDICMRMLLPAELAMCTGLSAHYTLDPLYDGKPLSRSDQVRAIGNAVVPHVIYHMVRVNFEHERKFLSPAQYLPELTYMHFDEDEREFVLRDAWLEKVA